jgi:hypothetical protein
MANILFPRKPLPALLTGTAYVASDFQEFDYSGAALTGSKPILHLNLKNGTTIDLPTTDEELKHLLVVLCGAFPTYAIHHLKQQWPSEFRS